MQTRCTPEVTGLDPETIAITMPNDAVTSRSSVHQAPRRKGA